MLSSSLLTWIVLCLLSYLNEHTAGSRSAQALPRGKARKCHAQVLEFNEEVENIFCTSQHQVCLAILIFA